MKADEVSSDLARNSVHDWLKTALMSRFDKPNEGRMIVVMQRLHQDDLFGRLRDEGGWTLLEMPGEAFTATTFDLGHGQRWEMRPGDLLFPERFDNAALAQQVADLGEVVFNAQILQRPTPPGGALFKLKHVQRYDTIPPGIERIVQSWDPAFTNSPQSDYSVCTTWGIKRRNLYLLDVFRKRLEFYQIEPALLALRKKWNAEFVLVEAAGAGLAVGNELVLREGVRSWLIPCRPTTGKNERAIAETPKFERKRIYLPIAAPWLETFEAELTSFPNSKYDDQVDSIVQFLQHVNLRIVMTSGLTARRDHPNQHF